MAVNPVNLCNKLSTAKQISDLKVFCHHVYEYQKGIRNLILTTEKSVYKDYIVDRLTKEQIDFAIQDVNANKINVFFGAKECVDVIKTFIHKKLNELTPEQDFILGILLGYDRRQQCKRYLSLQYKNNVLSFKK